MGGPYRIMTFNGGGIRGILSTQLLTQLEQQCPGLVSSVDLFAGTSAGAVIAAHLADGGEVGALTDFFTAFGEAVFFADAGKDPLKPAYSVSVLEAFQDKLYGAKLLSELSKSVVLTAFQVGNGVPWQPVLFSNLKDSPYADTPVVDAVVASSAMPGMFGSYKGYIDGAFVNHDPSLAAIACAVQQGVALEDIVLLDIGTGFMAQGIPTTADTSTWGAGQWQTYQAPDAPALLINGTQAPILNVSLNGTSVNLTAQLAGMLLGQRFLSLNPTLDQFVPENAVLKIPYLIETARATPLTQATSWVTSQWGLPVSRGSQQ